MIPNKTPIRILSSIATIITTNYIFLYLPSFLSNQSNNLDTALRYNETKTMPIVKAAKNIMTKTTTLTSTLTIISPQIILRCKFCKFFINFFIILYKLFIILRNRFKFIACINQNFAHLVRIS